MASGGNTWQGRGRGRGAWVFEDKTPQVGRDDKSPVTEEPRINPPIDAKSNHEVDPLPTTKMQNLQINEKSQHKEPDGQKELDGQKEPDGPQEPSRAQINEVARHIGRSWKMLGRNLIDHELLEVKLQDIEEQYRSSEDRAHHVLEFWKSSSLRQDYTVQNLVKGLNAIPRKDIVYKHFHEFIGPQQQAQQESIEESKKGKQGASRLSESYLGGSYTTPLQEQGDVGTPPDQIWTPTSEDEKAPATSENSTSTGVTFGKQPAVKAKNSDAFLIQNLRNSAIRKLCLQLDPDHPNGNWRKLGRNVGLNESHILQIQRDVDIENTPAFLLLGIIQSIDVEVSISGILEKLKRMRQNKVASNVQFYCTNQGIPLETSLQDKHFEIKKMIASEINEERPILGCWKDLADFYRIPRKDVEHLENGTNWGKSHRPTSKLLKVIVAHFPVFTVQRLADELRKMGRNDVAEVVDVFQLKREEYEEYEA